MVNREGRAKKRAPDDRCQASNPAGSTTVVQFAGVKAATTTARFQGNGPFSTLAACLASCIGDS